MIQRKFSVITPAYNPDPAHLAACIASVKRQTYKSCDFEVEHIVVDDGSTSVAHIPMLPQYSWFLGHNSGAGVARNLAISKATGDWFVFLDSDDELAPMALHSLSEIISCSPTIDLIGYNWSDFDSDVPRRKDGHYLNGSKEDLLAAYLALRMDGGPTFTAIRADLAQCVLFSTTKYHEDVRWLFQCYAIAHRPFYMPNVLYRKRRHAGAVTATVTEQHLKDFVSEWQKVGRLCGGHPAYERGIIGVVATRLREIHRAGKPELLPVFYKMLPIDWISIYMGTTLETQYAKLASLFAMTGELDASVIGKTWSCKDLQGSLFLAPDEVRACCKRFFVDGEQRGDVVLTKMPVSLTRVRTAKVALLDKINAGEPTACDGCPFMEFKHWEPVNDSINYLSLEHHSVCNLKCTYCTPTYYDGRLPQYNVSQFVERLIVDGNLQPSSMVVWGGGEPTAVKTFTPMAKRLEDAGVPQRVLTNAVQFSPHVANMLADGTAEVVVSVDAGTREMFKQLRGADHFSRVLFNLRIYRDAAADRVVIKYIVTSENCTFKEVSAFVSHMIHSELLHCNFQISCDFQDEVASRAQTDAILGLYNLLVAAGAEVVFLDDLARIRLRGIDIGKSWWRALAERLGWIKPTFATIPQDKLVVVWGGGEQLSRLNTRLPKTHIVIHNPLTSCHEGGAIIIAASQAYPAIYRRLKLLNQHHNIIKGLVL